MGAAKHSDSLSTMLWITRVSRPGWRARAVCTGKQPHTRGEDVWSKRVLLVVLQKEQKHVHISEGIDRGRVKLKRLCGMLAQTGAESTLDGETKKTFPSLRGACLACLGQLGQP